MKELGARLLWAVALLGMMTGVDPVAAQPGVEDDSALESCLAEGKILAGEEPLIGLTKPLKLTLDCDGSEIKAVFKNLDVHKQGVYMLANGDREFNFSDCYKYEVAAYRLDRELGLGMVPVSVLRRYRGEEGALIAWVPNAVHADRVRADHPGLATASIVRQKSVVRLFDSLIYNVDRRPPNILVDESQAKVFMIDHSQAFREKKDLPEGFVENRVWLSEETYDRLAALDKQRLDELLKGLVSRGQRKSLLLRRDLILEKIDRDRAEYGAEAVFRRPAQ